MSEEEILAYKEAKNILAYYKMGQVESIDIELVDILVKIIEKQQKEINKLRQQNKEFKVNTISKNKIRNEIEQLKPFLYTWKNAPQDLLQYRIKAKIQVLQELLESEA